MPVIECDASETRAIDCELWVDLISQRALEDRRRALEAISPTAWNTACSMFTGRATTRKRWTLDFITSSRALPCGRRASLPAEYFFLRDPDGDGALILWGDDVWEEEDETGRVWLRTYVPLRRYDPERDPSLTGEDQEVERFAGLDFD